MSTLSARDRAQQILDGIDVEALIDGILASFWEREEFRGSRPPLAELREFVRWNLDLALRWLIERQPPTEVELDRIRELGRAFGATGVPVDTVPANYRLGARFAWSAVIDSAGEIDRDLLRDGVGMLFDYVDRVTGVFVAAYEEGAGSSPVTAQERGAHALIERLTAGAELVAADHELAESIGFDLGAVTWAFSVRSQRSAQQHGTLARRLRARGILAVAQGRRVVGLASRRVAFAEFDPGPEAILAEAELTAGAALGAVLDELALVVDIATERGHTGTVSARDFPLELLLRGSPGPAARIHAQVYGCLPDGLAHTLDVLLENGFDRGRAAAALPVHRNTLHNRLVQIGELIGVDVDDVQGRALVTLAWLQRANAAAARARLELELAPE